MKFRDQTGADCLLRPATLLNLRKTEETVIVAAILIIFFILMYVPRHVPFTGTVMVKTLACGVGGSGKTQVASVTFSKLLNLSGLSYQQGTIMMPKKCLPGA